jgi:hypothetical protein
MIGPQSLPEEQLTVDQDRERADAPTAGSRAYYPLGCIPAKDHFPPVDAPFTQGKTLGSSLRVIGCCHLVGL